MTPPPPDTKAALAPRLQGYNARLLGAGDQDRVLALREAVLGDLGHDDLYVREDHERDFVAAHLGAQGRTIGLYDGTVLVAYAMLGLPRADDPDNFGHLLGLERADRARIGHLASCMVQPGYRGRGLQRALLNARLLLARAHGCTRCAGIVSLHNHASRHNLMREGLQVLWVGNWHGLRRQLLVREATRPRPPAAQGVRWVRADDYGGQLAAIAAGARGLSERRDGIDPTSPPWIGYAPL